MSKDPAILFYTSDFITGTLTMSDEQRGKYILLLCLQHQKGYLTEKDMLNICKTYDKDIYDKFRQNGDGHFYNERMKIESEKRIKYSESRRNNRIAKNLEEENEVKKENISKSYVKHMENENENINEDIDKNKIIFENFRKKYPGVKRGLDTEFEYFKKSNKDWKNILEKLESSLDNQIQIRQNKSLNNEFVPEWKNLKTWIFNKCWEEEIKVTSVEKKIFSYQEASDYSRNNGKKLSEMFQKHTLGWIKKQTL